MYTLLILAYLVYFKARAGSSGRSPLECLIHRNELVAGFVDALLVEFLLFRLEPSNSPYTLSALHVFVSKLFEHQKGLIQ